MKTLFLGFLFLTASAFADNQAVQMGRYSAVDQETGTVLTQLFLKADGTATFQLTSADFTIPDPGCSGTYTIVEHTLTAAMQCPVQDFNQVNVTIDITNATPDAVNSPAGVVVPVVIDALGTDPTNFVLKKIAD